MSPLTRDELVRDLGAEVLARASDPLEGWTMAWRRTGDLAPVAVRPSWHMPEGNGFVDVAIGRPGQSFASLAPHLKPNGWWSSAHLQTVGHGDVAELAPMDPSSIPQEILDAAQRTHGRLGTDQCPEALHHELAERFAVEHQRDSDSNWGFPHFPVLLDDAQTACASIAMDPGADPRRTFARLVDPTAVEAVADRRTGDHSLTPADAALVERLVDGLDALRDYHVPVESFRLDRVVEREAHDIARPHDREIEPLVARLTDRAATAHPDHDPAELDGTLRGALRSASRAMSARGAELAFLSALPRELRPTFAHDDGRALLHDTGRVARDHVRPRADQLHQLRHPSAGDRGRGAIALGR